MISVFIGLGLFMLAFILAFCSWEITRFFVANREKQAEFEKNIIQTLVIFFILLGAGFCSYGAACVGANETIEALKEERTYLQNRLEAEKGDNLKLQKQLDLDPDKRENYIKILKDSVKILDLEARLKALKADKAAGR